jgi:membrane protease YdiL (CAAX protease family)
MEELNLRTVGLPVANPDPSSIGKEYAMFIALAFGISWLIWISAIRLGARPGVGEEILGFGSAGPAIAAIFLSRSRRKVPTVSPTARLLWLGLLCAPCWAIYVVSDKMRGVTPTLSLRFGLIVALLAAIPAWIGSGAFSSDAGVRDLLRTLTVPQNWRWQAVAFFSFPVILVVPTAILHAFGVAVVWQRGSGTLWSLATYGAFMFLRNLFFTAFFEEPGWRGFLLPLLQRKCSPLLASLLVWLPWALWHAPLDFSGGVGHSLMYYVQIRVIFLIPITIIMTWLYDRSGGNILSTTIFHAGMNTFPFVLPYAPPVLGLIFVWAGYAVFADKMWRHQLNAAESSLLTTSSPRPRQV